MRKSPPSPLKSPSLPPLPLPPLESPHCRAPRPGGPCGGQPGGVKICPPRACENLVENLVENLCEKWCEKRMKKKAAPARAGVVLFFQPAAGLIFQLTRAAFFQLAGGLIFHPPARRSFQRRTPPPLSGPQGVWRADESGPSRFHLAGEAPRWSPRARPDRGGRGWGRWHRGGREPGPGGLTESPGTEKRKREGG